MLKQPCGWLCRRCCLWKTEIQFAVGRLTHCKNLKYATRSSSVTFLFFTELNANQRNTWENRQKYPMKETCHRFQWFELLAYRIPEPSKTVDSIDVFSFRKDKKGQMSLPKHPVRFSDNRIYIFGKKFSRTEIVWSLRMCHLFSTDWGFPYFVVKALY
jgi:hypothetical protein